MTKLIKMTNEAGKSADVHPDMVEDYKSAGYVAEKPKASKPKAND